jgi:ligand-binding sensor domain-containing protein/two-component sensor histidine kinase
MMFSKRPILLIFFTCGLLFSAAQQANFIKYSVYDGLVSNPVRCIYQDSKGFIWIGTYDGLSRYDGYKFTNYTTLNGLSHNLINSIFETDGKVLIAENNGGVDVFVNNRITKRFMAKSAINTINLVNDRVLFTSDSNSFYEYKNDSLLQTQQTSFHHSLGPLLPLGDSLLLSAGDDNYFFTYKKDLNLVSSLSLVSRSKYFGLHIYELFQDSKKRIWACSSSGLKLLSLHIGQDGEVSFLPLPAEFDFEPLRSHGVTSIVEEKDGTIWIGTFNGLVRLLPNGNFHVYNEKDGLPAGRIQSLYIDKEKNLWIGTVLGLAKWVSKNNVAFFNTETGDFKNNVTAISSLGNQKVILNTSHGLQEFDFDTKNFIDIQIPGKPYTALIEGSSPLLIYYPGRIVMLDSGKKIVVPVSTLDTAITGFICAAKHSNGLVFLGTFSGVYVINKTSVKKISPHRITSLAIDLDDHIWAGTWENGLFRITIKNSDKEFYDVVDMTARIKEKQVRGLYVDSKKNIWVGTRYGGAFCLTPKANDNYDALQFNRQTGLMSDWVSSFAETKKDDIWIGTYLGIDRLVKESSGYRVFNFSKAVNFFAEVRKIIPLKDDNWLCWANTGIGIFKDENLHQESPLQPSILTASLGILENKQTIILPNEKISIRPNQNAARFEFGALGFLNERQILYSYRLKGSGDTTWSKPENIHEASYVSLSPGNYTFEVKTIGWNGEYSIPATFSFFIGTPFWKQWWFIALGVVALVVFFYTLYRYRIRQLLRLQTVRNNIATDLHDDIGSSLTNISILSELSSKNISEPEKAQPFLQRISEEVQASSQAMDDIIWSVNSRNDSLQETMARMRRYAAELFDNSDIKCHLDLEENASNKKLTMEQRRDVYLIYKEALNNIHKHAAANNVWINVRQNQNHLLMKVKDDGKGFNTDLITHRNGLKNLRSRVDKWDGKIKIESEENKGTSIGIKIPLKD